MWKIKCLLMVRSTASSPEGEEEACLTAKTGVMRPEIMWTKLNKEKMYKSAMPMMLSREKLIITKNIKHVQKLF